MPASQSPPPLRFRYRNHRGEIADRTIRASGIGIWYGVNPPWHRDPQWLMAAYDIEKGETRNFALKDIIHFGERAPPPTSEIALCRCGGTPAWGGGGPGNHYLICTSCGIQTSDTARDTAKASWNRVMMDGPASVKDPDPRSVPTEIGPHEFAPIERGSHVCDRCNQPEASDIHSRVIPAPAVSAPKPDIARIALEHIVKLKHYGHHGSVEVAELALKLMDEKA